MSNVLVTKNHFLFSSALARSKNACGFLWHSFAVFFMKLLSCVQRAHKLAFGRCNAQKPQMQTSWIHNTPTTADPLVAVFSCIRMAQRLIIILTCQSLTTLHLKSVSLA